MRKELQVKLSKYRPTEEQEKGIREYVEEHKGKRERIPTVEDICIRLGIPSNVVREWGKKYPRISVFLDTISDLQRDFLIRHPNQGNVFLLKSMHDFSETKRIEVSQAWKVDNTPLDQLAGEILKALDKGKRHRKGTILKGEVLPEIEEV